MTGGKGEPVAGAQARVPGNDYSGLAPGELGSYRPRRSVSVVIPAFRSAATLPLTLAALAAQSYPSELLEVVVVDDGGDLRLPEIRPEHTRVVPSLPGGWGRAHACHSGALAAEGDVVHWLDADMVPYREHVAAQLRWHELADYLMVLGYKRFVDFTPGRLAPERVRDAVAAGAAGTLFDRASSTAHAFVDRVVAETDGLRNAGTLAYRVAMGATGSLTRAFYHEAGGMDTALRLGEDTELGYRLMQAGAVFIPEPLADSWHLGASTMMTNPEGPTRYNRPFITDRVTQPRRQRYGSVRRHRVPYVEVVVDAAGAAYEDVAATVNGVLGGILSDVVVTLTGPWSRLGEERRDLFGDLLLDLRLTREAYAADVRVRAVEAAEPSPGAVPFRFTCPAGWVPARDSLHRLTEEADAHGLGGIDLALPGAPAARLARTAAYRRARRVARPGEALDAVVAELYGARREAGASWGLMPASEVPDPGPVKDWRAAALQAETRLEKAQEEVRRLREELAGLPARGPRTRRFLRS